MDKVIPWPVRTTDSFRRALQSLLSLKREELDQIGVAVEADAGFKLQNSALSELQAKMSTPQTDVAEILAVCGFLYECMPTGDEARAQLLAELRELAEELQIGDLESKEDALRRIFAAKPAYDRVQRALRVSRSGLPVLEKTDFQCDLRAVIDQPGDAPQGWVPMIIARFGFDEPIAGQDAIVFQMTDVGLDDLESSLRGIRETFNQAKKELQERA